MRRIKFLTAILALFVVTTMTSCLHIIEEINVKKDGSGSYTMKLDMSEMKSMMDMFKGMQDGKGEEDAVEEDEDGEVRDIVVDRSKEESDEPEVVMDDDGGMDDSGLGDADPSKIGEEFTNVSETLKKVKGLSNVQAINDSSAFMFGYSFDFQDIASLNKGLELVNKEKFDAKAENVFKSSRKKFSRSGSANFGEEIKRTLSEGGDEEGAESIGMMKMFFGEMSYKQIYHFERKIKKSSNKYSEISDDRHTLTVKILPFSETYKDATVATDIKLK